MTQMPPHPNIATLAGIKVTEGERLFCRAICHFQTEDGQTFEVPLGTVIEALRFAMSEGLLPPFPFDWDWQAEWNDGCRAGNPIGGRSYDASPMNAEEVTSPDNETLETLVELEDTKTATVFHIPVASLLQALAIAEQKHLIMPLDPEYRKTLIPKTVDESIQHLIDADKKRGATS